MENEREYVIQDPQTKSESPSNLTASLSNFSVQYNLGCASIAVEIMQSQKDKKVSGLSADFPEPFWAEHLLLGTVYLGTICGMIMFGYLGDVLAKTTCLVITLSLTIIGALGGAVFSFGDMQFIYAVICFFRFILGIGVGGIYPLSASYAAETSESKITVNKIKRVAWAFIWQLPGAISPYIVALILMMPGRLRPSTLNSMTTAWQFRTMLGLGAIPAVVVLILTMRDNRTIFSDIKNSWRQNPSLIEEIRTNRKYWKMLFATCSTWFLYDIAVFGTFTFMPMILDSIFGQEETLIEDAWHSIVVSAFGIPGVLMTIALLNFMSLRVLLLLGFLSMSLVFAALGVGYYCNCKAEFLFVLFCLISFVTNLGVSVVTFVLPAVVAFPQHITSGFHGLSAASAKIGAAAGALMYPSLKDIGGVATIMLFQSAISFLGFLIAYFFVDEDISKDDGDLSQDLLQEGEVTDS